VTPARERRRAAVLAAVTRAVKPRFSLSLGQFADLLIERAERVAARDPVDYVNRLSLDDLYLATACTTGDEAAWHECRDRYFDYIRNFTRRFVHDRAAADVADEVIADLWSRGRLGRYDGRSGLRTWLGAVAAHAAINTGRIEQRMTPLVPELAERAPAGARPAPADPAEDRDTHRVFASLVTQALAALEPGDKLLLQLYYEQHLTLDQMEGVLGLSKPTLSRRLDRVRRRIRDAVEVAARRDFKLTGDRLRERLDFARLEFDLSAALGGGAGDKGT
jgi:RNA polymerase sigma-70 factor